MPTGYTADVGDGKVTTLQDFALRCARAFGATIMMRDEPWDKPIPERFEPTAYHVEKLDTLRKQLSEFDAATPEERAVASAVENEELEARHAGYREKNEQTRERYVAMIAKVEGWRVPSELSELRGFMLDQLRRSIDFDCCAYETPKYFTGPAWAVAHREKLLKEIAYHEKAHAEEVERVAGRNRWIKALRDVLAEEGA